MLKSRCSVLGSITETDEPERPISSVLTRKHPPLVRQTTAERILLPPLSATVNGIQAPTRVQSRNGSQEAELPNDTALVSSALRLECKPQYKGFTFESPDDVTALTPKQIEAAKLPKRFYFGKAENDDHYVVNLGRPTVCRRRAASVTDPHYMTEEERRLLNFLEHEDNKHGGHGPRRRGSSRIYTDQSLVVDPNLTLSDFTPTRRATWANPSQVSLPRIYTQTPLPLVRKDYSPALSTKYRIPREISDATWEELKDCRYLRPSAMKFREAYARDRRYAGTPYYSDDDEAMLFDISFK